MYLCESTSGALHNQGFGGKSWNHSWRRHLKKQSTKQLSCVYVIRPTRRALFILFQEEVSWKSSPSVQKNPQPDWRTAPSCSHPLEKDFRHSSSFFCSCDTCNCASVRSKAKQKLVYQQLNGRPLRKAPVSLKVVVRLNPLSLCSELGAAACPDSDKSPAHSSFQCHQGIVGSILAEFHLGQSHSAYLELPLMFHQVTILHCLS